MPRNSLLKSTVFEFLGQLWLSEVDAATLHKLNQPGVRAAFEQLGGSVPAEIGVETLERLAIDYCQLLIGPKGQLPPVQSIWEEQQFQGDAAASMNRYFKLIDGYQPPTGIVDHLGVQLNFAASLILATETEPSAQALVMQYANDHLCWCGSFLKQISDKANTEFYRSLADVTKQVLDTFLEKP